MTSQAEPMPDPAPQPFDWQHPREKKGDAGIRRALLQTAVDEWNAANPTLATPFGQENLARAEAIPSIQVMKHGTKRADGTTYAFEQMWIDRFDRDPDLMWQIVGDIIRFVSSEETPRGARTSSRRQIQDKHRNMATVNALLSGRSYSNEPFPVAVRDLIGDRSMRLFATRAGFGSHVTLLRYLRGERPLTMDALESMAKAGRVEPHYFLEYRAMWLGRELQRAFLARPGESVRAVKAVQNAVT